MTSFLTIDDLPTDKILALLALAEQIRLQPQAFADSLRQSHFALLFEKPSLRTRASFAVGIERMGGQVHFYDLQHDKLGQRESIRDFALNLEQWYQGIIARVDRHQTLQQLKQYSRLPVINALCDQHHPCQALADVLTLYQINPDFHQWHMAYVGDGNNVARSLVDCALKLGFRLSLCTPTCARLDDEYWQRVVVASGGSVSWSSDLSNIQKCDVIYTDVWRSMGENHKCGDWRQNYWPYQVNASLMQQWQAQWFMHCQPVHRGEEATDEVCDSSASLMYRQAANRMLVQQALLHFIYQEKPL
jgi:ornithine carbamoyltransferase